MAEHIKGVAHLRLTPDGRSAENWASFKLQTENTLSSRVIEGIYLDDVLANVRTGKQPDDPGNSESEWIAAASAGSLRTAPEFATASKAWTNWSRANRVAHGHIMSLLPAELHDAAAQRPLVHELWAYLADRFAGQTLTSLALLNAGLFTMTLANFDNVAAFLTAMAKKEAEIRAAGGEVHTSMLAGVILNAMGDRWPSTKELMLTLPKDQQTREVFAKRLLEAEKNEHLVADFQAAVLGPNSNKPGATPKATPCGYIRQLQGNHARATPGSRCRGFHSRASCWAAKDDKWLKDHPDKTAADLPDWRAQGIGQKKKNAPVAAAAESEGLKDADVMLAENPCTGNEKIIDFFSEYMLAATQSVAEVVHTAGEVAHAALEAAHSWYTTVVLDNGATTTCLNQGTDKQPLPQPVTVHGACEGNSVTTQETVAIPCPALGPHGQLRGLYSSKFRHNLISVKDLQRQGVEVTFPAHGKTAECRDPRTGKLTWQFSVGPSGLYEARLRTSATRYTHLAGSVTTIPAEESLHPTTLLHQRLGHISDTYLRTLI